MQAKMYNEAIGNVIKFVSHCISENSLQSIDAPLSWIAECHKHTGEDELLYTGYAKRAHYWNALQMSKPQDYYKNLARDSLGVELDVELGD